MSWYRDSDGKIITDEEYRNDCMECECFCQEGMINIPCNGERTDCPYFKEVDTSEYDKEIRNKIVEKFAEKMHELCGYEENDYQYPYLLHESRIDEIAEQMKGE